MALTGFLSIIIIVCCCLCGASSVLAESQTTWYGLPLGDNVLAESVLAGFGALCLLVMALLFWNRSLKIAVNKRTTELKRREHEFRSLAENLPDVVSRIDREGRHLYVNSKIEPISGLPQAAFIGKTNRDLGMPGDLLVQWDSAIAQVFESRSSVTLDFDFPSPSGVLNFEALLIPEFGRDDEVQTILGISRNVSERKQANDALRQSEERLRIIFETSESGIILVNPQGVIDFANRRMAEMFAMSHDEMIGTSYSEHLHESEKLIGDERMRQLILGKIKTVATERRYIRKDGSDFWGYLSGRRLENPDGSLRALVGFITDITERKQMTRMLAENEVRLRTLVQTLPDLIWLKDVDGVYLSCNAMFERFFGAREADIIGKTDYDFVSRELADFFREHDRNAMAAGKPTSNEEWITFADDGHHALLDTIKTPMYDSEGELIGVLGIARDITDRKDSEERRLELERQLLHSQKLESLGILSGGIAHDFNNLLLVVLGNLDLALMKLPEEAIARKNIGQAITASRHAAKLTNMMLAYSGKGSFIIKELSLTELVEENVAMLSAAISKSIKLELQLDHALPLIMADAGQIQQVVMNLITNASEAIGDAKGSITLATGVNEFDPSTLQHSRLEEKLPSGSYVWLEVRDTGCGMDVDTLHKLFDPFFTTKFTGRGLGMSAVLGIIRAHKGAFLVESKPAAGTTIKALFPIVDFPRTEQANTPVGATKDVTVPSSAGAILIVDDEEMIRGVCFDLIEELGFEALVAGDGEEALRIFREHGNRICLVLLDQVMPGMDGVSVFKELRCIRPDIKVLLASGYSEQEVSERFIGLGLDGFIQKPFSLDSLSDELRRMLSDAG